MKVKKYKPMILTFGVETLLQKRIFKMQFEDVTEVLIR